jgi:hypothetical protein
MKKADPVTDAPVNSREQHASQLECERAHEHEHDYTSHT